MSFKNEQQFNKTQNKYLLLNVYYELFNIKKKMKDKLKNKLILLPVFANNMTL